jgi:hypothetical protein
MAFWLNKFCPGFMCVPWKPHEFGNEYHTICDGLLGGGNGRPILWRTMIQEGKDCPKELGNKKYHVNKKPTVGLVCQMVEPIKGSRKCITGDSGFCVPQACVELLRTNGCVQPIPYQEEGAVLASGDTRGYD